MYLVTLKDFLKISYYKIKLFSKITVLLQSVATSEGKLQDTVTDFQYLNTFFKILR